MTRVVAPQGPNEVTLLREQLDPGEAEAIVVAAELEAELLPVDEKRGLPPGNGCMALWGLSDSKGRCGTHL